MLELLSKLFGPRPPCKCGKRMVPLRRGIPIFVCVCGAMKIGQNTVTLDGAANKIVWNASGTPTAIGDLGMDMATGRLRFFRAGAVRDVAGMDDITSEAFQSAIFSGVFVGPSPATFSTGALSFTPKLALIFINSNQAVRMMSSAGSAKSTLAADMVATRNIWNPAGESGSSDSGAFSGIVGRLLTSTIGGYAEQNVTATAFGAGGITLSASFPFGHTLADNAVMVITLG